MIFENMIQIEHVPFPDVPAQIKTDLKRFSRINLWHGIFPKFFYEWVFNKDIEDNCVSVVALNKMCIERYSTLHEITFSTIIIEDH